LQQSELCLLPWHSMTPVGRVADFAGTVQYMVETVLAEQS
jgi:hypothetical protein